MAKSKKLSNPFSTGGGGAHFEAHVQASYVVLMLTGGYAPCFPYWPIVEIKLQGKIDGFDTDDLIVTVENPGNKERSKMLGQIKHSIAITQGSKLFGEVMQAAWNDFNSPKFSKERDVIALITGPLSASDVNNVQWLLNQARHTKNADEFFRNIEQANFSSFKSKEKLSVIYGHLIRANDGREVSRDELYNFLNHFHLLSYDLGNEFGIDLSLLNSHISQFHQQDPNWVWSRIIDIIQTWNQDGGTITSDKLPEDIIEAFKKKVLSEMPDELRLSTEEPKQDWTHHPNSAYLALAVLIGAWNEKSKGDIKVITQLFGIDYNAWLQIARDILHCPDSPLSLKNGTWKAVDRIELWKLLGSQIFDQDLEKFKYLVLTILKEPNPAFELPADERYMAVLHGKVMDHSNVLRKGVAEGLAILGSQPDVCINCSQGKVEEICYVVIHEILADADWLQWGSLNSVLPGLAEAAPGGFLDAVERAMRLSPCPFDELFSQERNGVLGENLLTGLLWALEGLAWDEQYLVRVCVVLGELASHDPGGQWANRPSNSLTTILLPWLPQTLASADKRMVVVQTLLKEVPKIAWNLIIQLLPGQHQTSFETYKPKWRKVIPDQLEKGVTHEEYWLQVSSYAELAVNVAGYDTARLTELIDHFDNLPKPAFDQLIGVLLSKNITDLPENQRLLLWDHLTKFIAKQKRFSHAKWALPIELVTHINYVAEQIAPTNPVNLYQHLFTERDFQLYEEGDGWEEKQKKLNARREMAIKEIFQQNGIEGVRLFAESVDSPEKVGHALGVIEDEILEQNLLPYYLNSTNKKYTALVSGFIWRRYQINGWEWCDSLDKSGWNSEQKGYFLACLPFIRETWHRAYKWLKERQGEYWSRTGANAYQDNCDLTYAIKKLIEHRRPHAAINCLARMLFDKQPINGDLCVRALLSGMSSDEPSYVIDEYYITELIKYLQTQPSVDQEALSRIEWAYLPFLDGSNEATPKILERRMANSPGFFCEVLQLLYRSKKRNQQTKEPTKESQSIAKNAWTLLYNWKTTPGIQEDGTFSAEHFNEWLLNVKTLCMETGHLEVALTQIGMVLIYAPTDPDGLWIHQAVATALNDRDAEDMRNGYSTATFNSRGAHWIDPTGKPEIELAEQFRRKAEEVENGGFQRFAITLRKLAENYEHEAKRIIDEHKNRDEEQANP